MSDQDDSADKSHEPTQRKLEKAREKGEFARSADLNTAAGYAGLLLVLVTTGPGVVDNFGAALRAFLDRPAQMAEHGAHPGLGQPGIAALFSLLPWLVGPGCAVALVIAVQRGFVFAPTKLSFKLSRISPISNAKNKFGRSGLFEFVKSFTKLMLYSVVLTVFLVLRHEELAALALLDTRLALVQLAQVTMDFLLIVVLVATGLGVIDYMWQRAEHIRKNRMSDKEMRDEIKESEGDPYIKQSRRQRAQSIAMNQMMADVPDASVVIVNPTHFAVALKWDRTRGTAPTVCAKGVDEVARAIREAAMTAGVPIHSDPPTARALYDTVAIGSEIEQSHYRAVAAAIRFADMLRAKRRARGFG